jgi:ribosome assembly protein YihI (activator of Der GTPase)
MRAGDSATLTSNFVQVDELHSRYLLTFASARVGNEWWALVQTHYPDATRPGSQLFSFEEDFLEKAWSQEAFAHLKPKWMYVQLNDTTGGATQTIIPVQDARGNLLAGTSSSPEQHSENETKEDTRNGVKTLEERFEKMMEVVERNTEQISALATAKETPGDRNAPTTVNGKADSADTSELSGHLGRISQLLEKNCAHVAGLAERQLENEQKMREMLEAQHAKETSQQPDMSQLTSHLDRIQKMMERTAHGRKDSARDIRTSPPRVDLSPLTFWLEKVLSAIEQNTELVRELIQEKDDSRQPISSQKIELDLSPLSQRLDDLLDAQDAKSTRDQEAVTQMNTRLDKIIDAHHKAVERGPFDVSLLSQRLDEILSVHRNAATETLVGKLDELLEVQSRPLDLSQVSEHLEDLDCGVLTEPLEAIRAATEQHNEHLVSLVEAQHASAHEEQYSHYLQLLREHLEALRTTTEHNSCTMVELLESMAVSRQVVTETNSTALTPFDDRVGNAMDRQSESNGIGDSKFLLSALTSHLSQIQAVTESNANAVRATRESSHALQRSMTAAVSETSGNVQALAAKHKDLAAQVAVREGQVKEMMRGQAEMVASVRELAKTIKAQDQTEVVASVRELAKTIKAQDQAGMVESVRDLAKSVKAQDQPGMVECVRNLANTIKAQEKPTACGHIVIPPPRKTNRKVVGYVYDTKDGKRESVDRGTTR